MQKFFKKCSLQSFFTIIFIEKLSKQIEYRFLDIDTVLRKWVNALNLHVILHVIMLQVICTLHFVYQ